jgi:hypothetical protein
LNFEAPWKSIPKMDKRTLQTIGTVVLIAGLVFGSIGAYRIATNLPISDEKALAEARRTLLSGKEATENQRGESLRGNVEFQVWKSALQVTNRVSTEERSKGLVHLVSGFILLIWGMTMVYNSR